MKYKAHHALRYFIMCLPDGLIVYVSEPLAGNITDCNEYDISRVRYLLEETYPLRVVDAWIKQGIQFHIGGDKGYIHLVPPFPDGYSWGVTVTKSGLKELRKASNQTGDDARTQSTCVFDKNLARPRAVIERRIGKMKAWKMLSAGRQRIADDYPRAEMVQLVAAVENRKMELRRQQTDE